MSIICLTLLKSLCITGVHCCSLHHSQSQEEGEGKERKGGGEDGGGEWKYSIIQNDLVLSIYILIFPCLFFKEFHTKMKMFTLHCNLLNIVYVQMINYQDLSSVGGRAKLKQINLI